MKINILKTLLLIVLLNTTVANGARADLQITLTPSVTTLQEGQSGLLNVLVSSNSSDELDGFTAIFNISGTSPSGLVFSPVQAESHLTDSNYVFFGRSDSVINSYSSTTGNTGNEIVVGDISNDGSNASFPFAIPASPSNSLLATIGFTAVTAGDYDLNLDALGSSFSNVALAGFDFTVTGTSVNVTAVPEPSSVLLFAGAMGGLLGLRRRWSRTASPTRALFSPIGSDQMH